MPDQIRRRITKTNAEEYGSDDGPELPEELVGMDLRIRRISAAAEALLHTVPADVGQPVGCLSKAVDLPQIESVVAESMKTGQSLERRVRPSDGHSYTMRVIPSHTAEHATQGCVLEFLRVRPLRKGAPFEVNELVGKVLSGLPDVLTLLDDQLRIVWGNQQFFAMFSIGGEALGKPLDEVWPVSESHPAFWESLEDTAAGGPPISGYKMTGAQDNPMLTCSARLISPEPDRPAVVLLVLERPQDPSKPAA